MKMSDVYSAKALAHVHEEVASNKIPFLGEGLFPRQKKASLDLKWVKTMGGLPVSLMPSAFDTTSTIRSREGFEITETEMAYFKESMLLKEADEQEIMRVQDSADPFAQEVINRIYNDAQTLLDGADVVPERMRMQLLCAKNGTPSITIAGDGATYTYNYDPNGTYRANNYVELQGTSKWDDTVNSDPIQDVSDAIDKVEARTGSRPTRMIVSKKTMNLLKKNEKIKGYILAQNMTANVIITDARVNEVFSSELGVNIIVYTKQFKDENGTVQKFFADGVATLIPNGALGNTWFGMTPEERTGVQDKAKDVAITNGVAVAVTITDDPIHTKTTVSEICLPSFERIDETFTISCF